MEGRGCSEILGYYSKPMYIFTSRWMFSFFYSVLSIHIMGVLFVLLIKAVTRDPHLFDKPIVEIVRDSQHSCSWASDSLFGMEDHLRGFLRWGFLLFENWSYSGHCPVDLLSSNVRLWINDCQSPVNKVTWLSTLRNCKPSLVLAVDFMSKPSSP